MNLLQSLVIRTLETASTIAPPRVPFVSLFPGIATDAGEADVSTAVSSPATAPTESAAPPTRVSRPSEPPVTAPDAIAPSAERSPAPAPRDRAATRHDEPQRGTKDRVIERRITDAPPPISPPAVPPEPATVVMPATPPSAVETRHVHDVHHHYQITHESQPVVRVVEHSVEKVIQPHAPLAESRPASPLPLAPPPVIPRAVAIPTAVASTPRAEVASTREAAPSPIIHVAIDRIVVRLQSAPAATPTETTRPVPPAVDLETYTSARRRKRR